MSNNVIKLLENSEYSIDDYYKIINLCNRKIINIDTNKKNKIFLDNVEKISINNKELDYFFDIIFGSLNFYTENLDYYKSIVISFAYKENTIEYCLYEDETESVFLEEKINIINKNGLSFETYTKNCDEKLIKILELKSVNIKEFSDFIKALFECVPVKIV
jgi:hypothetical protein